MVEDSVFVEGSVLVEGNVLVEDSAWVPKYLGLGYNRIGSER